MSLIAGGAGRPRGVALLGYFYLGIAGAMLLYGLQIAFVRGAKVVGGEAAWPYLLPVLPGALLPAVWVGTAGWGMLAGRGWSRALIIALAVLVLVIGAGTIPGIGSSPEASLRGGVALGCLAMTGGTAWYLFSSRAEGWFRSRQGG